MNLLPVSVVKHAVAAWEACVTMNDSGGYQSADDNWKSPKTIVKNIVTCARDGGNYLLNIGPKGDGSIPEPSIATLTGVGKWMDTHGDLIHNAEYCKVKRSEFANFTRRGNSLYVHVHYWDGPSFGIGGLKTKSLERAIIRPARKFSSNRTTFGFC